LRDLVKRIHAGSSRANIDGVVGEASNASASSSSGHGHSTTTSEGAGAEDGSDDDANSPYAVLGRWIEENPDEDSKARAVAIFKRAEELGIERKHKTVMIVVQALFTPDIVQEIDQYGALFTKLVTSEKHQKSLLGGIERFLGFNNPDLIPIVPKILMGFYQIDVLDEEVITQWGTHVSKKYVDKDTSKKVRKASEPFLKWLQEADDDDDDDE